jgi:2'-5' RNA ligase
MKELFVKRFRFAKGMKVLTLLVLTACTTLPRFNAPTSKEKAEFVAHTEEKPMQAYLAMNLPYADYKPLFEEVQKTEGLTLKNRGEAHITVISPVEYDKILKKHLSIADIHKIAQEFKIQDAEVHPVCVGRGQKEIKGQMEKTYYVVVDSAALMELRGRIEEAYEKRGGKPQEFVPERFFPHVTLGYTARDLHYEDGVHKDKDSCLYAFKDVPQNN